MTLNATRVECGTLGTDACAYRTVAEQLPDVAVLVLDPDLRFELVTGAAVRHAGWRPEEILGRTLLKLLPPGLTSMRERVQALGGQLAIQTGRGGTSIQAWVPAGPRPAPRRPR